MITRRGGAKIFLLAFSAQRRLKSRAQSPDLPML
jgi:hypothetical protein